MDDPKHFLSVQFRGVKRIHIAVHPLPPLISRILIFLQNPNTVPI